MTTISCNVQFLNDTDPFSCTSYLEPPRPLTYSFNIHIPLVEQLTTLQRVLRAPQKPDECALQLYRSYGVGGSQGDFGTYIDLDVSLSEQPEELELLKEGKRTSMVLRTQLSVRVHTIIEKLLNSTGRELRRALFSLKQIFQDDKDLVHEFVQNDGLACLIKVGAEADQNYQNYILRALGQVMLYVDGMNGVIAHNETIQWLYSLLTSKFRLVVKTALKLLLVFVEYTESNSLLLLAAVYIVDKDRGSMAWSNLMTALSERDTSDPELFIYAMTLLNKILNGIPDQDTFYDVVDACEEQGLEGEIRRMISMNNRELTEQCRQYENTLRLEDGDDSAESSVVVKRNVPRTIAGNERKSRRRTEQDSQQQRNSLNGTATPIERTRMSDQNRPTKVQEIFEKNNSYYDTANSPLISSREKMDDLSTSRNMPQDRTRVAMKKYSGSPETPGLPSAKKLTMEMLYRTKQPSQQQDDNDDSEAGGNGEFANGPGGHDDNNNNHPLSPFTNGHARVPMAPQFVQPKGGQVNAMAERIQRTSSSSASTPLSPTSGVSSMELKPAMGEESAGGANTFANALSRARKSMSSKIEATTGPQLCMTQISTTSNGKPEGDLQWEQAIEGVSGRPLVINDLDFTELDDSDDMDPFHLASAASMANSPLPGSSNGYSAGPPAPPPLGFYGGGVPPPPGRAPPPPSLAPPPLNFANGRLSPLNASPSGRGSCDYNGRAESPTGLARTDVKTLKLFWKEVKPMPLPPVIEKRGGTFWNQIAPVEIDTSKLCQLFEMKAKEIAPKKKEDKKLEILVLDTKRSNAINIALTKLPPPRAIKTAILKFDSSIMNKEGIEKVVTQLLPTEEEKEKIAEAQMLNPDVPLGSAENFLLTLASIPELRPRLRLWLFMVDYANLEREVAEPLMDLKRAMEELETCKTFQYVMATLLSIGNFLNGAEVRGFQLEYLAKVPEIKDTVHKHSMVHHLCSIVMEKFTDSTDLYSEFGAVARCAKVDFEEVAFNLERMEKDCKSSWDYLRALAKCESHAMKQKISEFLADCAQRILTLKVIHRRVMNRFHKFLLFMGLPLHVAKETKVNSICKIISEFSLEYRTTRERLLQQKRRTVEKRERNKTRGRTIIETKYGGSVATPNRTQSHEDEERHDELSRVLQSRPSACDGGENWSSSSGTLPGRMRHRNTPVLSNCGTFPRNGQMSASGVSGDPNAESPDDEILDGLVKAATVQTSRAPCERRKARQFNRKSLRRTRTLKLQDDQIVDA